MAKKTAKMCFCTFFLGFFDVFRPFKWVIYFYSNPFKNFGPL